MAALCSVFARLASAAGGRCRDLVCYYLGMLGAGQPWQPKAAHVCRITMRRCTTDVPYTASTIMS